MQAVEPAIAVDDVTLERTGAGIVRQKAGGTGTNELADGAVTSPKGKASIGKKTYATSLAIVPGTAMTSIVAAAGNRLVNLSIAGRGTSGGGGASVTITVTYNDDTTTVVNLTNDGFVGNDAGIVYGLGGVLAFTALDHTKGIKSVVATTGGTQNNARHVALSALEVLA